MLKRCPSSSHSSANKPLGNARILLGRGGAVHVVLESLKGVDRFQLVFKRSPERPFSVRKAIPVSSLNDESIAGAGMTTGSGVASPRMTVHESSSWLMKPRIQTLRSRVSRLHSRGRPSATGCGLQICCKSDFSVKFTPSRRQSSDSTWDFIVAVARRKGQNLPL